MNFTLKLLLKIIIPILLLGASYLGAKYLIATGPQPKKKSVSERIPVVETIPIKQQDFTVYIKASGVVKAGIQSNLVSEVSGKVIEVSDRFQEGAYFNKNSVLVKIDQQNYLTAVSIAESEVAANQASLSQIIVEQKSNQRSIDLAKKNLALGKKEVARLKALWRKKIIARSQLDAEEQKVNQLEQKLQDLQGKQNTYASRRAAIEAKINTAKARLQQERLNLSRTIIKAPYAGRVLKKNVDIGQYVSTGALLGQIYATDYVLVELPLSLSQYALLDLPDAFRDGAGDSRSTNHYPAVTFSYSDGLHQSSWEGRVVRSSAALDPESRQIMVIARIDKPFEKKQGVYEPIRIGQYLKARIKGKTFRNVYVLPPSSVRHNREILLLKDGVVDVVPVRVLLNTADATVIEGTHSIVGEKLITTMLSQAMSGMKVISLKERLKQRLKQQGKEKQQDKSQSSQESTTTELENRKLNQQADPEIKHRDSKNKERNSD